MGIVLQYKQLLIMNDMLLGRVMYYIKDVCGVCVVCVCDITNV